jgi:hypothetical protein
MDDRWSAGLQATSSSQCDVVAVAGWRRSGRGQSLDAQPVPLSGKRVRTASKAAPSPGGRRVAERNSGSRRGERVASFWGESCSVGSHAGSRGSARPVGVALTRAGGCRTSGPRLRGRPRPYAPPLFPRARLSVACAPLARGGGAGALGSGGGVVDGATGDSHRRGPGRHAGARVGDRGAGSITSLLELERRCAAIGGSQWRAVGTLCSGQ